MALSTNSVFHFTKSIEAVKSILNSNFRIKYCVETIESKERTISYAVPMVSFCDIPLSQVSSHIKKYGGYGIGLSKAWAKRKGLNPVLYIEKRSTILNDVLIKEKFEHDYNRALQEFLRYTKNYEGKLYRNDKLEQKVYRYYDEREWRFCPAFNDNERDRAIAHDVAHYRANKDDINASLSMLSLDFRLSDVSYIIVQDDEEILDIIENLENNIGGQTKSSQIKILTSKIMTSKQISSDF